jgi:signal transduction histidine kinase
MNSTAPGAQPGAGSTVTDIARGALLITRQLELPRVLHEIATQARALLGAERAVAEVSRDLVGGEPLRVTSVASSESQEPKVTRWISAEMRGDGDREIGRVTVYEGTTRSSFTASDHAVLQQLAEVGAAAVANARLRAAERRTRSHAARLQELSAALSEAVTVEEVTDAVVHHLTNAFDADGAVVARCTEDGTELEILGASDMPDNVRVEWQRFPTSADVPLAEVARVGHAIFLESREAWLRRYPHLRAVVEGSSHHANAVLPLIARNQVIGSIGLAFCEPRLFDPDDRALATSIARQCSFALDRARLYEAELQARQRAEAANLSKSEFLAVMSHELRTPLNAISGYAELMLMGIHGSLTPEQREDLERIQRSQRHLLGIINNLLDYAKIEGGSVRIRSENVSVCDVIEAVLTLVSPQIQAKELNCDYTVPDGLHMLADAEKAEQIVLNLVANAVKFTPRGGAVVISAQVVETNVEIAVSDTGPGIPPEMHARIFEPFVQLEAPVTAHTAGPGLGLAISRDLARLMRGSIRVEGVDPAGARFVLTLPAGAQ